MLSIYVGMIPRNGIDSSNDYNKSDPYGDFEIAQSINRLL